MTIVPSTTATQEAAAWHTRLSRRSITTKELLAFRAWRQDETNAAAYAEVEATWSAAGRLAQDPDIQSAARAALPRPAPRATVAWSPIPRARSGFGLAAVLIAAGLAWFGYDARTHPSWTTRIGEQRLVVLSDGSRIRLNTDSRIKVRLGQNHRDVALTRGEAFFEVAHDPQRPFTVTAGPAAVRAIGTRFDVRRDDGAVRITLVEGRVGVRQALGPTTTLLPDQQVILTATTFSSPRPTDATDATSWTDGRLIFRDTPLRDAVAEVNRYTTRKIVLEAPEATGRRGVTGAFNTGNSQAFVAAIGMAFGMQSRTDSNGDIHLGPQAPASGS